jgi:hypothetical protein
MNKESISAHPAGDMSIGAALFIQRAFQQIKCWPIISSIFNRLKLKALSISCPKKIHS